MGKNIIYPVPYIMTSHFKWAHVLTCKKDFPPLWDIQYIMISVLKGDPKMHPSMRPPILSPLVKKKIILYSCSSLSLSYKDTLTRFFSPPGFFVLGYVFYVLWDKEVLFREKNGYKKIFVKVFL